MKILILEDNKSLLASLEAQFKQCQWDIQTASSYGEALDLIKKETFDIYLIDILLPDNKGHKLLSQIDHTLKSHFIFMSSFFKFEMIEKEIPELLKDYCHFFKKPFKPEDLISKIKDLSKQKKKSNFSQSHESLEDHSLEGTTFETEQLPSIVLLAQRYKFTGTLEFVLNTEEKYKVEFVEGSAFKVLSSNQESYFGALLIEYNIALEEDIESILQEKDDQPIGKRLLNKGLLNHHMLGLILREQVKIRLSQLMSSGRSFIVNIIKNKPVYDLPVDLNFDERDLMEWIIDSLNTQINDNFLEKFYSNNKYSLFVKNNTTDTSLKNDFIKNYNEFLNTIESEKSLESIIDEKNKFQSLRFIYFGVLTKSINIKYIENEKINVKQIENLSDSILSKKDDDLFGVLNIPWQASKEEINKKYKQLIKVLHVDNLGNEVTPELKKKSQEAMAKLHSVYKILSDTTDRQKYVKQQEADVFVKNLNSYQKAINYIKSKEFKSAIDLLESIKNHANCPKDINLYMAWAKIKLSGSNANKNILGRIKKDLDTCPIDLRVNPLYWFVTGIYYAKLENYEKAIALLNKAIKAKKGFREAHEEKIAIKKHLQKIKSTDKGFLSKLFDKKSA